MSESGQQRLFEVIDADEFAKAHVKRERTSSPRAPKTEPRNQTTWWALTTHFGECTVPRHEEVQELLTAEQKQYRRKYGRMRMCAEIGELRVCRDCFQVGADKT